ncbi:MAG TPA: AAA family ATPase [Chloroflexota bacterium]
MRNPIVLIITGHPATGKTTLGVRLAADLSLPFFSKDGVKESLFDTLGWLDRAWSKRLGHATYGILYYIAETMLAAGASFAVESNFDPVTANVEFLRLKTLYPFRPVQVLCRADGSVLLERFRQRDLVGERHPGHVDQTTMDELNGRILGGDLAALSVGGPVIRVDTTDLTALDYTLVLERVRQAIDSHESAVP